MRRQALLFILISTSVGACGGEVHFVSPQKTVKTEAPQAAIPTTTDLFRYGQPSGSAAILFLIYPRKSMQEAKKHLFDTVETFTDFVASRLSLLDTVRIGIGRDTSPAAAQWWGSAMEPIAISSTSSSMFLKQQLDHFQIERQPAEGESFSPYASLNETLAPLQYARLDQTKPFWIHVFYIKDRDLDSVDSGLLEETKKELLSTLKQAYLSPYRFTLEMVAHTRAEENCLPPSRIATRLVGSLAPLHPESREICDFLTDPGQWADDFTRSILRNQSRLVLSRAPDLTSLEVKIGGKAIPRQDIRFDPGANEILLTEAVAPLLNPNEEIQVNYVAK